MNPFFRENYGNLLDFDSVLQHLYSICEEESLDKKNAIDLSKALTLFALQSRFEDLPPDEAWDCIVDGGNDQSFDAIFIEEGEDGQNTVNILQSKCFTTKDNILERRFPAGELEKFVNKFDDFIVQRQFHEHANEKLRIKLNEIYGLKNPTYRLIILTTALPPPSEVTARFVTQIKNYNHSSRKHVDYEFIGLSDLAAHLPTVAEDKIDFELQLDGGVVEANAGRSRVVIGMVQGRTIAELVRKENEKLFQKNVRGYLRQRNAVNQNIYTTATGIDDAPYFFVLNNGITIVCDNADYMSGQRSPMVKIAGGQIVNGGQTSFSLFEALRDNKIQNTVEVLVRIIQTHEKGILENITEATNRQTAVSSRDLHSNDDIQKKIKSYINDKYGYQYESRKNEMEGKAPIRFRMDAEKAAQAYYSYILGEPAIAKSNKAKLFNQYYEQIFSVDNDKLPEELFFSYRLITCLDALRRSLIEEYPYYRDAYRDAQVTLLALLRENSKVDNPDVLEKDEKNNFKLLHNDVSNILAGVKVIVDQESKKLGENFEKRRLFISPSTFGRMQEVLNRAI